MTTDSIALQSKDTYRRRKGNTRCVLRMVCALHDTHWLAASLCAALIAQRETRYFASPLSNLTIFSSHGSGVGSSSAMS
jgi:hypothetical protein